MPVYGTDENSPPVSADHPRVVAKWGAFYPGTDPTEEPDTGLFDVLVYSDTGHLLLSVCGVSESATLKKAHDALGYTLRVLRGLSPISYRDRFPYYEMLNRRYLVVLELCGRADLAALIRDEDDARTDARLEAQLDAEAEAYEE